MQPADTRGRDSHRLDLPGPDTRGRGAGGLDEDRVVEYVDDAPVLPDSTRDDTDAGWGEQASDNDDRLLADRPPHWG